MYNVKRTLKISIFPPLSRSQVFKFSLLADDDDHDMNFRDEEIRHCSDNSVCCLYGSYRQKTSLNPPQKVENP